MSWNPCYIEFALYIETFHYIVRRHFEIPKKKVGTRLPSLHTPVVRIVVAINNSCCINLNVDRALFIQNKLVRNVPCKQTSPDYAEHISKFQIKK